MLVHAVVSSRLYYCNSLFFNMKQQNTFKLQKVQNAAARLITRKRKRDSVRETLKELHWLRIESRVIFKLILITYKCIYGLCSKNLKIKYKNFNCRPNDEMQLETIRVKTKYGKKDFWLRFSSSLECSSTQSSQRGRHWKVQEKFEDNTVHGFSRFHETCIYVQLVEGTNHSHMSALKRDSMSRA